MIYLTGSHGFIGEAIAAYYGEENVIRHIRKTMPRMHGITKVIHCAAYGNHSTQTNPTEMIRTNCLELIELLETAQRYDVSEFINISSSSVTLNKQTLYSLTKAIGEKIASNFKIGRAHV